MLYAKTVAVSGLVSENQPIFQGTPSEQPREGLVYLLRSQNRERGKRWEVMLHDTSPLPDHRIEEPDLKKETRVWEGFLPTYHVFYFWSDWDGAAWIYAPHPDGYILFYYEDKEDEDPALSSNGWRPANSEEMLIYEADRDHLPRVYPAASAERIRLENESAERPIEQDRPRSSVDSRASGKERIIALLTVLGAAARSLENFRHLSEVLDERLANVVTVLQSLLKALVGNREIDPDAALRAAQKAGLPTTLLKEILNVQFPQKPVRGDLQKLIEVVAAEDPLRFLEEI